MLVVILGFLFICMCLIVRVIPDTLQIIRAPREEPPSPVYLQAQKEVASLCVAQGITPDGRLLSDLPLPEISPVPKLGPLRAHYHDQLRASLYTVNVVTPNVSGTTVEFFRSRPSQTPMTIAMYGGATDGTDAVVCIQAPDSTPATDAAAPYDTSWFSYSQERRLK